MIGSLLLVAVLTVGQPVAGQPPTPSADQISGSITSFTTAGSVTAYSLHGSITSLATVRRSAHSTTLALGTDVLFDFGSARLDPASVTVLDQRLRAIPHGARVAVAGYTDSVGAPSSNLTLSRRRARAVAAAVAVARPDLVPSATGHGEASPVAPNSVNGHDNPAGRAQNRRVTLRWPTP
jgi:outer membrane protein OmpA-like peptidoglycan-associated protein